MYIRASPAVDAFSLIVEARSHTFWVERNHTGIDQTTIMASSNRSWDHCVDQRMSIIKDGLGEHQHLQEKLPGLKSLLEDYLAPDNDVGTDADQEGFHRRLLQVFRDSQADFTYEQWLQKFRPDEQKRIADFVEGRPAGEVGKDFRFGLSLGVREHNELMLQAEGGPAVVDGLNVKSGVEHDTVFHRLLHGLAELAEPLEPRKCDSIVVSVPSANLRV